MKDNKRDLTKEAKLLLNGIMVRDFRLYRHKFLSSDQRSCTWIMVINYLLGEGEVFTEKSQIEVNTLFIIWIEKND